MILTTSFLFAEHLYQPRATGFSGPIPTAFKKI